MPETHDPLPDRLDEAASLFRRQRDIANCTLDSLGDAVIAINSAGIIELVNRQAELLTGYTRDELAGQGLEILIEDGLKTSHEAFRRGFAANPSARVMGQDREVRLRRKDGAASPVVVRIVSYPVEGVGIFSSAQFRSKEP